MDVIYNFLYQNKTNHLLNESLLHHSKTEMKIIDNFIYLMMVFSSIYVF